MSGSEKRLCNEGQSSVYGVVDSCGYDKTNNDSILFCLIWEECSDLLYCQLTQGGVYCSISLQVYFISVKLTVLVFIVSVLPYVDGVGSIVNELFHICILLANPAITFLHTFV
jgi:hypothetical protein